MSMIDPINGLDMNFTKEGHYWAKLVSPSNMPEGEDWASLDWEVVAVWDNNGEGDEEWSIQVPGVPETQWPKDCVFGHRVDFPIEGSDGWIIGNGDNTMWRVWVNGMPNWTSDRTQATRYHRRVDAENVHKEDDDAWTVKPY